MLQLLSGDQSKLISALMIYPIVILMLLISIKLYISRKKAPYLSLTAALFVTFLIYSTSIFFNHSQSVNNTSSPLLQGFTNSSYILLVMGFYQLYNVTSKRGRLIFYLICSIPLLLMKLYWMNTCFIILFTLGAWYFLSKAIGKDSKFQWSFAALLGYKILDIIVNHTDSHSFWLVCYNVLPLLYYSLLFFILFERVLEIMHSSYRSSITDPLTGLYNRKYLNNKLSNYIIGGASVYVVFGDIDNFKKLNDTKGHKIGDETLQHVASILREETEGHGIVARYGGEEMVILISNPNLNMKVFTEIIRSRIEKETIVTVSLGYSLHHPGTLPEDLIKQADSAMYKSKNSGKNKVIFYEEDVI
jgi:diguanylate cyclase (GGDEF)-like protein